MTETLTRNMTININVHPKAHQGQEDVRTFPTTRNGALEFLELMQVEAPHVWYDLQGIAAEMEMLSREARGDELEAGELMTRAQWWIQEPLDALIPVVGDHKGDYWVTITEGLLDDGSVEVDRFPLFRGLVDTAEGGRIPGYILRGVLEARGYVDAAEADITAPPAERHAEDAQQYRPVNIVREGEL